MTMLKEVHVMVSAKNYEERCGHIADWDRNVQHQQVRNHLQVGRCRQRLENTSQDSHAYFVFKRLCLQKAKERLSGHRNVQHKQVGNHLQASTEVICITGW